MKICNNFFLHGYQVVESSVFLSIKKKIQNNILKNLNLIIKFQKLNLKLVQNFDQSIKKINLYDQKNKTSILSNFYEIFPSVPEFYSLADNAYFKNIIKKYGIKKAIISNGPTIRIDYPQKNIFMTKAHQDIWYSLISNNSLTIWFNLTTLKSKDGPLTIYKDSHKYGIFNFKKTTKYSTHKLVTNKKLKKKQIILKENQFLIFNQKLVHESGKNISSKPRVSIQLRFHNFFDLKKITSSFKFDVSNYVKSHVNDHLSKDSKSA